MTLRADRYFRIPAASDARVPPGALIVVLARDGERCVYCGARESQMQVDHVRPCAHFARRVPARVVNALSNLVTACSHCNATKGPQDLEGFARALVARGVAQDRVDSMCLRVTLATATPGDTVIVRRRRSP